MDAVLEQAHAHGANRVHRIVLRIGALAGVEPEALQFAFEIVTRNTIAAEAELAVDDVPAQAWCAKCDSEFSVRNSFIFSCPRCAVLSADLRRGRELEVARIEMS